MIGASAGGLASLQAVVARLPSDFPWPVVVVQHSDPRKESHLPEILGRDTKIPTRLLADGDTLAPGIHVCPPAMTARFGTDGTVGLQPVSGHPPRTVTTTFVTVAEAYGDRAVAVVLSGSGNDGAAGAVEIKRRGGTVVVESEASAGHFSMPRAVIQAGAADLVRLAEEIADALVRIVRGEHEAMRPADEEAVAGIFEFVEKERGTPLDQYRPSTLRRRLHRHVFLKGYASYGAFLDAIRKDPALIDALFDTLLINVSGFFRDSDAFAYLEEHVVPELVRRLDQHGSLRVWSAGCATGEEAFSIAMLLAERTDPAGWSRIKIFATDLDANAIETARAARYSAHDLEAVGDARREGFFHPVEGGFEVRKDLRRMVIFGVHDLMNDPPIANVDLVLCRNVLIYFDVPMQRRVLDAFSFSLVDGGFLFLGRSETVGGDAAFEPLDRRLRIFRRGAAGRHARRKRPPRAVMTASGTSGIPGRLADHLLEHAGLVLVVLGPDDGVAYANRHARTFAARHDASTREDLASTFPLLHQPKVLDAIRAAREGGRRTRHDAVSCSYRDRRVVFDLNVGPVEGSPGHVLILAEDVTTQDDLRRNLRERGVALQESVEDLQVANEELQAANEEMETTNEELQSTNEELTTLNEELQSTNEELETTNEELQSTNEQLDNANAALARAGEAVAWTERLFRIATDDVQDAVIVLDGDEKVTHWSLQARRMFGEVESEVLGRSVLATRLRVVGDVLRETLHRTAVERIPETIPQVRALDQDEKERHVSIYVHPLERTDDTPGGWVLTCRDLTPLRSIERAGKEAVARYAAVLRGSGEGVLVVDEDGRIRDPNPRAVELLTRGGKARLPDHIWDLTDDASAVFEIKGALADLARGPERRAAAHTVKVAFRDAPALTLTFVAADVPGLAPVVLVRPA